MVNSVKGTFNARYDHARSFFRDRRTAVIRPLAYSLSGIPVSDVLPTIFGGYAALRLLTMKKGEPGNWQAALHLPMLANGLVPLMPLAYMHQIDPENTVFKALSLPPQGFPEGYFPPLDYFVYFVGLPLLLGIGRYVHSLCASGKVIRELAGAAAAEESRAVAESFLTARARIDRKIVFKTMKELKAENEAKFLEIYDLMRTVEVSCQRTQKLLGQLKILAEGGHD